MGALFRNEVRPFIQKSFGILSPGQKFVPCWHIDAIAWQLDRIRRGDIKRLIINMPPRSLKSIAASVAYPAYILGHDPTRRIICVSYSGDLAKKHSNDFRALIESAWYRELFPSTRIGLFKNTETEIELTKRGFRLATSVGGTLTGRGGDLIIIDDPLKPDDAYSESKRTSANEWFNNTLLSRLDDKRTGAIIIVMQRVHMDDLTGFVTEQSPEWEILNLPAIAESDQLVSLWNDESYLRKRGEVLSPEREPLQVLEAIKLQIGSDAFSAQYQQMPIPPGGAMIKRHWIKRYTELPPLPEHVMFLQSWDTANKGGPENDFSVCTTWLLAQGVRWYLADLWRGRVDYPTLKAQLISLSRHWRARRVLMEDAGAGTMLVQELVRQVPGIVSVKPDRDKNSRMAAASSKIEAGQVYLPERAPWLHDLEVELFAFPGSRNDDQVDSISQALLDNSPGLFGWFTPGDWQELMRQVRMMPRRRLY